VLTETGDKGEHHDDAEKHAQVPLWLEKEVNVEVEFEIQEFDVSTLFSENIVKPKRKARMTSAITRDPTTGRRTTQIIVPTVEKEKGKITLDEFQISTVDLGFANEDQEGQWCRAPRSTLVPKVTLFAFFFESCGFDCNKALAMSIWSFLCGQDD